MSRDEDDRDFEGVEEIVNGLQPRAAVGQLNVSQDQTRALGLRQGGRLGPRASDANGAVPEVLDQLFKIERDQNLVFDNQDIGGNLGRKLPPRLIDEILQR